MNQTPFVTMPVEEERDETQDMDSCSSSMPHEELPASPSFVESGIIPPAPESIEQAGLTLSFIQDLAVKHLYRSGILTGKELAAHLHLPILLIDPVLENMINLMYAEKRGSQGYGLVTDRFALTDRGKAHARDLLQIDTYIGPAPVPLDHYTEYVKQHGVNTLEIRESMLRHAWSDFILDESLFTQIGPAVCSGKSCFLYGPPGTGKTTIARAIARLLDEYIGGIAVPHALLVDDSIIRLYDPVYHKALVSPSPPKQESVWLADHNCDPRWIPCHRPGVMAGGELTLDMLDLRYNPTARFYEAPIQLKATGGVLIIDDFGRQLVRPKDLLNRWIIPLEERMDYLTLHTGKKFSVPFEQLVIFATNLDPNDLADEAFLRRIRYKIYIGEPSAEAYTAIFDRECKKKKLTYEPEALKAMIRKHYRQAKRPLRACDPRDISDRISDYCHFNQVSRHITHDLLDTIYSAYLRDL